LNSFGSAVSTVFGIALMFAMFSLLASVVAEIASTAFHLKASMLNRTVTSLLTGAWGRNLSPDRPHAAATIRLLSDPRVRNRFPGIQGKRPNPTSIETTLFVDLVFGYFIQPGPTNAQNTHHAIDKLPPDGLGDTLRKMWADAGHDVDNFRRLVGVWYESAMEELEQWYLRRQQLFLFGTGVVLAVGLNVSIFHAASNLWGDPTTGTAAVASCTVAGSPPASTPSQPILASAIQCQTQPIQQMFFGWHRQSLPRNFGAWLVRLLDWLIVALGVSLGAPYWFDVLAKFAKLRSTA
jgi:hypothetical protein